jgi:tetratricopeptide (TPR) repeat protein
MIFNSHRISFLLILILALLDTASYGQNQKKWQIKNVLIPTKWAQEVSPENVLPEYPRPQMMRKRWFNLNGLWDFEISPKDAPVPNSFRGKILVPFPLESALSGVKGSLQPSENLWYRRTFIKPDSKDKNRILLHFGAVDWEATIYINGHQVGYHSGGYQAFTLDISDVVKPGKNELLVKVYDPTDKGIGPHGKQVLDPSNIYYTPSSGIWQTVWMETVPSQYINRIKITPDIDKNILNILVDAPAGLKVRAIALAAGSKIGTVDGKAGAILQLRVKSPHLWSPADPFLYDLNIELIKDGKVIDTVDSYFGMRKIAIQKDEKGVDRIFLNNKPYFNLGTLDQGFWPDGLYTAPTDNALKFDIEAIKAMGFNTIRKHIKVEPARWYYHTDKLGMLVWQDFVNPNQGLPEGAKPEYEKETKETLEQLHNYPSITTWVIFNEKWGAYDQQRITEWVKSADSSRIVNGHSGELLYVNDELRSPSENAYAGSDLTDVHSYPYPGHIFRMSGKASVLGEFGGIGVALEGHVWDDVSVGWGYSGILTVDSLKAQYSRMIDSVLYLKDKGLSGSIYTQPFDVETEQNGLITYDRAVVKVPLSWIRAENQKIYQYERNNLDAAVETLLAVADSSVKPYLDRKVEFKSGRTDSAFLRSLAMMSFANRDTAISDLAKDRYLNQIKVPCSEPNLKLILKLVRTTNDSMFKFLTKNIACVNAVFGKNVAEVVIMRVIYDDRIARYLSAGDVDWQKVESELIPEFGELAAERINAAKVVYYLDKKEWGNYADSYRRHFEKAIVTGRNSLHINNMTWYIFENVNDNEILKFAVKVMQYNLQKFDQLNANAFDTYANLLYKLGNKQEALVQQKIAIKLSNDAEEFKKTYERILKGEKTWN